MFGFLKKHKKDTAPRTQKDYAELGKQVQAVYEAINPDRAAVYRTALIKGIFTGVGTVVGATLVIALLAWVLSLFSEIPLVGGFVESIQTTIEEQ